MDAIDLLTVILIGMILGSFATAVSYRLPRDLSMLAMKRSQCPECHKNLGIADLVPLFSWLFLKGRCRYCAAGIGWRYPLIEIATLSLCLAFYSVYGFRAETFMIMALAPVLVSIFDIDLHHKIIPDSLNLSILLIGFAMFFTNAVLSDDMAAFIMDRAGGAIGGAFLYGLGSLLLRQAVMMIKKREAMGLGDVKFFAATGFWLGLNADAAALFMIISGMSGIILALIWKKYSGEAEVPFAPSLIIAFIAVLCLYVPSFISVRA